MAELVSELVAKNRVMVFSKTYCPYCTKAKQALASVGLTQYGLLELDGHARGDEARRVARRGACAVVGAQPTGLQPAASARFRLGAPTGLQTAASARCRLGARAALRARARCSHGLRRADAGTRRAAEADGRALGAARLC